MDNENHSTFDTHSLCSGEIRELMNTVCGQAPVTDASVKRFSGFVAAHNIGKEVALRFELKECLKLLVDSIADILSVEIISLMLMEHDGTRLSIEFAKGLSEEALKNTKINVGEGVAGWCAKTGEPLLLEDITRDERFHLRAGRYYTNSLLSVPLKISNRVIGVINVNNKTSRSVFVKDDLEVLSTVAELAAVAIENARFRKDTHAQDQTRSKLISNVSHEFRTPLTAIKEAVCLMLEGVSGTVTDQQKRFLTIAKQNIERLTRLSEELLDLAKLESGNSDTRKFFDIHAIISSTIDLLHLLAQEKNISFTRSLPHGAVEMWGDADKLAQVITNLLGNSIKYNKQGGAIEVCLTATEEFVTINVIDTGIGIPAQDVEKIFDRFYRVHMPIDMQKYATGLGLAITREIVRAHGGQISVASQIDKGSVFTVILPKDMRKRKEHNG